MFHWMLVAPQGPRVCFQAKIPFLIRQCAHLVVSAHISLQVKNKFVQEKKCQRLSTTSPLWFWRRIRLVVGYISVTGFCFLCVIEHHVLKLTFHRNVKKNLFHISTNNSRIFSGILASQRVQRPISLPPVIVSAISSIVHFDDPSWVLTFCYCTAGETRSILIVT